MIHVSIYNLLILSYWAFNIYIYI